MQVIASPASVRLHHPVAQQYIRRGALLSRNLGIAPVARRDTMDLTDEEFAAVGSAGTPIRTQTHIHLRESEWLPDAYLEMISQ